MAHMGAAAKEAEERMQSEEAEESSGAAHSQERMRPKERHEDGAIMGRRRPRMAGGNEPEPDQSHQSDKAESDQSIGD
jgi:hypothetical protein